MITPAALTSPPYPTAAEEAASLKQYVGAKGGIITNFNKGGVSDTYLKAIAVALGSDASTIGARQPGAYEFLQRLRTALSIVTAQGADLDNKANDVGITRKPATKAKALVVYSIDTATISDTVWVAGSLIGAAPADPTQPTNLYTLDTAATVVAGATTAASVSATSVLAGSGGNADIGALNQILSGPSGSVTNIAAAGGGLDTEQDDAPFGGLRQRALDAVPAASQGTVFSIAANMKSYAGVVTSLVLDNTAADGQTFQLGRMQIYVDDGSGDLGNPSGANFGLLAQIQGDLTIGLWRAGGTQAFVAGSIKLATTVQLTVDFAKAYIDGGGTVAAGIVAVQTAVQAYFSTIGIGKPALLAEIVRAAAGVNAVSNVVLGSVQINGLAQDIFPQPNQSPRVSLLSDVAVTVISGLTSYP